MSDDQNEMGKIPSKWRGTQIKRPVSAGCGNIGSCSFGIPHGEVNGMAALGDIPEAASEFHFYLGGNATGLMSSFVASHAGNVEILSVGNSSFAYDYGKESYLDYREMVAILSRGYFPNLKVLDLGVWELFHNAHCMYGKLGDITELLRNMPNLEKLRLYGYFELHQTLNFNRLELLWVQLDDPVTCANEDSIPNATLENLTLSRFPNLKDLWLDLEVGDEQCVYSLPEPFFRVEHMPLLEKVEINALLEQGQKEKLLQSPLAQKPGCKLFYDEPE